METKFSTENFYKDLKIVIGFIDDDNVELEAKEELIEDFCSIYVHFDSNKLYNYLYEKYKHLYEREEF